MGETNGGRVCWGGTKPPKPIALVGSEEWGEGQLFKLWPHRSWDQRVVPWGTNLDVTPLSLFDLLSSPSVAFSPVLTFSFHHIPGPFICLLVNLASCSPSHRVNLSISHPSHVTLFPFSQRSHHPPSVQNTPLMKCKTE